MKKTKIPKEGIIAQCFDADEYVFKGHITKEEAIQKLKEKNIKMTK